MAKDQTLDEPKYQGQVRSALAIIRRELRNGGFPLGSIAGRYHPFGPPQKITPGLRAWRVGCSRTISISYLTEPNFCEPDTAKAQRKNIEQDAYAFLRTKGLPINPKGYMDCLYH